MAEKKAKKSEYVRKFRESRKPKQKKGRAAIVIGKTFTAEELHKLLLDLRAKERERSIAAAIKFSGNVEAVKAAASKDPNIDIKSITETAVETIKNESEIVLSVLEETKKIAALTYISKTEKIPEPIRHEADTALKRIEIANESKKFEIKSKAEMEVKEFTPIMITDLWKALNSTKKQTQVKGAITLFTFYSRIAQTMSKVPNLTLSQLMVLAKDITYQNTDPLFREIIKTWNRAAAGFLASSKTIPKKIRERAQAVLKAMGEAPKITAPKVQPEEPKEEIVKIGKEEVAVHKPTIALEKFDVQKVKRLAVEMRSREHDRSIIAAINFFSNYQEISQVVTKIPLLTISQLKDKAVSIASKHSGDFFLKLTQIKNFKALEFIAKSEAIPQELSNKAQEVLDYLLLKKPKKKTTAVPKVIMKEGGEPDDEEEG
jgi:hypothetical protein